VAVASNATIICGRAAISWTDFVGLTASLSCCRASQNSVPGSYNVWDALSRVISFEQIRVLHDFYNRGAALPIRTLVACNAQRCATDKRDLVYGFLGLAANVDYTLIDPGYSPSISAPDVCVDLIKHSILRDKCIEIICMGQGTEGTEADSRVPSWAMNWPESHDAQPGNERASPFPLLSKFEVLEVNIRHKQEFRASGNVLPIASITKSPSIIT
jgi:hypothetical protein